MNRDTKPRSGWLILAVFSIIGVAFCVTLLVTLLAISDNSGAGPSKTYTCRCDERNEISCEPTVTLGEAR